MLGGFPTMTRLDLEGATASVAGYLQVVRNCPPWAVIKACEQVRTGQAGLHTSFCPSEPQFYEVVRAIVTPYELQLAKTEAMLNAELPRAASASPSPKPWPPPVDKGYARRAIIGRIRKLWALGTDNPNAAEADSAKERALALIEQHNILPTELGPPPTVFELDPTTWDQ